MCNSGRALTTKLTLALCISFALEITAKVFITNKSDRWGRLGHNLMHYVAAKYLATKYKLPFLYQPFIHSKLLRLDRVEQRYTPDQKFSEKIIIKNEKLLQKYVAQNTEPRPTLCIADFAIPIPSFGIKLRNDLKELIYPIEPFTKIDFPKEPTATIAIHVRRGDVVNKPQYWSKQASDKLYIHALGQLLSELHNDKVYVHIFTDDKNPQAIAHKYKAALKNKEGNTNTKSITFHASHLSYISTKRTTDFGWNNAQQSGRTIIADLFAMASFDYLIRPPTSSFSMLAHFVGNHRKVIVVGKTTGLEAHTLAYLPHHLRKGAPA